MILLAVDPGPTKSSYCLYDVLEDKPISFYTVFNSATFTFPIKPTHVVIEKMACYGMPVGETVLETVYWSGELACQMRYQGIQIIDRITRKEVVVQLCRSARAKDTNVIQAMKDRFGEKGTKKKPGLLYGIKADEWQALGLAVAYSELYLNKKVPA